MVLLPWKIHRETITKDDVTANPSYGCFPEKRPIEKHLRYGIINLDKPSGPSSHEVVAWIKRILNIKHAGHGGTLDPKVTGVLPVALEEATKIVGSFLISGKEYICVMRLHKDVSEGKIKDVLKDFVGNILQRPPLRSSVKRNVRLRSIYYITDLEFRNRHVLFRVGCQAGTYIRKLVHDVGEALGSGAHMEELRRTRAGPFTEEKGLSTLYDIMEGYDLWITKGDESMLKRVIMPMEKALKLLPKIYVRDSAVSSICHGAKLTIPGIVRLETDIRVKDSVGIFSLKGELIALGRAALSSEDMLKREHGIAVNTKRVVMDLDEYPRLWRSSTAIKSQIQKTLHKN